MLQLVFNTGGTEKSCISEIHIFTDLKTKPITTISNKRNLIAILQFPRINRKIISLRWRPLSPWIKGRNLFAVFCSSYWMGKGRKWPPLHHTSHSSQRANSVV